MDKKSVTWEDAEKVENLLHGLIRRLTTGAGAADDPVADLPLAQLRLCNALRGKGRSMSAISRELGTSLSAVTQIADRLERAELVKRVQRGDDRRVRCLRLTDQGEEMMRLHEEHRIRRMSRVLEYLTAEQREAAAAALESLVQAAGEAVDMNNDEQTLKPHYSADARVMI